RKPVGMRLFIELNKDIEGFIDGDFY
ncbi:hypothetical protein IGJ16_002958, partial [Enterococcus pernyi]